MKHLSLIVTLLFFVTVIGCSRSSAPNDLPKLYPCTITVTQEGSPLAGAYIALIPADGSKSKYQTATYADASGKAVMKTYAQPGVPEGKYKVVVAKNIEDDFVYGKDGNGKETLLSTTSYRTVEPLYSSAETAPHEIEVPAQKSGTFDVGKAVKVKIE